MNSNNILFSASGLLHAAGLLALFCPAFYGCARVDGGSEPPAAQATPAASDPRVRVVVESTQATYEGLRIGVGYVRSGEYSEGAALKKGKVAGLWLYFRDDPAKNSKVEVHSGQKVEAGGYSFAVEDISGGMKGSVRLRFDAGAAK